MSAINPNRSNIQQQGPQASIRDEEEKMAQLAVQIVNLFSSQNSSSLNGRTMFISPEFSSALLSAKMHGHLPVITKLPKQSRVDSLAGNEFVQAAAQNGVNSLAPVNPSVSATSSSLLPGPTDKPTV